MRTRHVLAGLACLAAGGGALAAAGCGSSSVTGALDPVAQAAQVTTHAGGAHLAMTIAMTVEGHELSLRGQGTLDPAGREGEITMDMSGLSGLGSLAAGTTMTELFKGDDYYAGSSALAGKLPGGARWVKVNIAKEAGRLGLDPQSVASGESNPAEYLKYLGSVSNSVQKTGTASVRGVSTTVYAATIDMSKATAQASRGSASTDERIAGLFGKLGMSSVPVTVWVDPQHRVRKLQMQLNASVSGHAFAMSIAEELFDFGPIPAVNAPSDSEVYEPPLPSLSSLGG